MSKYTVRRLALAGAMTMSMATGLVLVGATTDAHSETRQEMQCKDAASEGDESRMVKRFAECERKYGARALAKKRAKKLPACEQEDGPGPCVWIATEMGNGRGMSFWITCGQRIHYFNDKAERRHGGEVIDYPTRCK